MKVTIVFAEDVIIDSLSGRQQIKITNPAISFKVPFVPTTMTMSAAIIISKIDTSKEHHFEIQLFDSNSPDKIIFSILDQRLPAGLPGENTVINVALRNTPFMRAGEYTARIMIDGEIFKDSFFIVGEKLIAPSEAS